MNLALIILSAASVVELCLWLPFLWNFRKPICWAVITSLLVGSVTLVSSHPRFWSALLLIVSGYRVFNLLRIVQGRMQVDFLRQVTRRTTQSLVGVQLLMVGATLLVRADHLSSVAAWTVVGVAQLLVALTLALSTRRHLQTTKTLLPAKAYADQDLPTLTVAIPARNETEDLDHCLQALITSDYPKLEILVLDDCSPNKRTPEIIRSFAHDGVHFIQGKQPTDTWLAKNFAYEQLTEAASGELILFCGVDVAFEPNALRTLVSTLLAKQKSMLSVLPQNALPRDALTYLIQPARYAWELSLPRRLFNRPPVLSTCWMVKKTFLVNNGSFKAASRSVTPESYFARSARIHDGYSFVRSNLVVSNKPFSEQRDTAIRTRYPQLHRRPELVCLVSIGELGFVIGPFAVLGYTILHHALVPSLLSGIAALLTIIFYSIVVGVTYRRFRVWQIILVPFASVTDILLLSYSMWKYEFDEVIWKGRNVCLPVMRIFPTLPPFK